MGRLVHIRRHSEEGSKKILYYFTDYLSPINKIVTPISQCIEGFVEIDLEKRIYSLKECTEGLESSQKKWIIDCVMAKIEKALEKNDFPDILDFRS